MDMEAKISFLPFPSFGFEFLEICLCGRIKKEGQSKDILLNPAFSLESLIKINFQRGLIHNVPLYG